METVKKYAKMILIILLILFSLYKLNEYVNNKKSGSNPVNLTLTEAQDSSKLKDAVNSNSGAKLNNYQAKEVSTTITKIIDNNRKPDQITNTTGSNYKQEVTNYAKSQKADAVVVTPAKGESTNFSDIKSTDNITLNQYNIKAYPKHQFSVAHYTDGDTTVDYETQVKVFGAHAYVGPTVKVSNNGKGATVGVKVTIPF